MSTPIRTIAALTLALAVVLGAPAAAPAQDHSTIYTSRALDADAERLKTVIRKLNDIVEQFLTPAEKQALRKRRVEFPMPSPGDHAIDFYAFSDFGEAVAVMPIMSLKMLEDVTTAYAWLLTQGHAPSTIDLYFTMIRRDDPSGFPGGRYPPLLATLGVPEDAWKHPPVDDLSLRLRNEAFAFAFFHELGHILHKHESYEDLTVAEALADEIEADRFALDILSRSKTPALGASLLFQAQAFSLPHRGQFDSDAEWLTYIEERGRHPMTGDRLRAFADYVSTELAEQRSGERDIWAFIGRGLHQMAEMFDDQDMQECMAYAGETLSVDALAPRSEAGLSAFLDACP
ncbi:MAG: hypothetical protein AAFV62_09040 [Pseudomonadota bacterium]